MEVLLVDVDLLGAQEVGGHLVEAVLSCQVQGRVVVVVALKSRSILAVCVIRGQEIPYTDFQMLKPSKTFAASVYSA